MNKIKNILAIIFSIILIYSCENTNNLPVDTFDHEAQALIDNDTLVQFLKNHYYDTSTDSIKLLTSGKVALYEEVNTMNITENEIEGIKKCFAMYIKFPKNKWNSCNYNDFIKSYSISFKWCMGIT